MYHGIRLKDAGDKFRQAYQIVMQKLLAQEQHPTQIPYDNEAWWNSFLAWELIVRYVKQAELSYTELRDSSLSTSQR